jgi:hypothetical protein
MADRLTLQPAASLELIESSDSNTENDDADSSTADQADFITGVRRRLRKIGGFSPSRSRPANIQTGESQTSRATDTGTRSAIAYSGPSASLQYGRGINSFDTYEKPLPKTPRSPPIQDLLGTLYSPAETPRPLYTMSRIGGSRTSTMDSTTSVPILQTQLGGSKSSGGAQLSDMNDGHGSFAGTSSKIDGEEGDDTKDLITPRSTGPASAGPSPAVAGSRSAGVSNVPPSTGAPSTHLSGLMCNVHRTTGKEPHPLVGATTTILGDKLYVFGGRILSRSKPVLTSDLYELDLIRRNWIKLETTGDVPPPRYFHSMCPLGDTKLVCYGGMSPAISPSGQPLSASSSQTGQDTQPEVVVMSDIYIYDAATKVWTFIPTQDTPQGRYAHCATILPSSATFSSANAPMSAIHHNPSSTNPNQGTIGVNIDGTGGADMVIVGGQDSANHYIEQISVFNLRSLKWTSTQPLGKSCGAYRSVVAPLPGVVSSRIGKASPSKSENSNPGISQEAKEPGSSMLIYSNYNFLDVKLELQIRSADGTLAEKPMAGSFTPPGLRFPNGGVIDTNFVVSGTYLTSSKQEYALWALDLRTLTWSRIDAGGTVFSQGSWNRGVLWNRRNTFVILGNRKRSLVEDYNHRRLNFTNVCMVELEAFGLYDNPRKISPMSGFVSSSSPIGIVLQPPSGPVKPGSFSAGGRTLSKAAEELGSAALNLRELADMDILAVGGERIPVNSRIIARRWGPYFIQLLREGAATQDGNDTATLRPSPFGHNPSRNSSITITPAFSSNMSTLSTSSTLNELGPGTESLPTSFTTTSASSQGPSQERDLAAILNPPTPVTLLPTSRPRTLYLPHTYLTLQSLLHFLYTSSLPPPTSNLCTPQILCSLLQLARPYRIDGLLEAVVERLHGILDSRNAAAVFNAAAMAAGGGRGIGGWIFPGGEFLNDPSMDPANGSLIEEVSQNEKELVTRTRDGLRINTSFTNLNSGARLRAGSNTTGTNTDTDDEDDPKSAVSSTTSSSIFDSENEGGSRDDGERRKKRGNRVRSGEIWNGGLSAVIGLQKRGLRGLMEGRRLRERGTSVTKEGQGGPGANARVGLGVTG